MSRQVARSRAHDFALWLLELTPRWPKRLRHSLTSRLEEGAVGLIADLAAADTLRGGARLRRLERADARLAALRALLRLAYDLHLLSSGGYREAARRSDEIGRLVGGWERATAGVSVGQGASVTNSA